MELSPEQRDFQQTLRRFFAETSPMGEVRRLAETEAGYDAGLWGRMTGELGLPGLAIPESQGGGGFGPAELGIALLELGRGLVCAPFLSSAVLAAGALRFAAAPPLRDEWLGAIARGETVALALLEPGGGWEPGDVALRAEPGAGEGAARLFGAKTLVVDGESARHLIAVARAPGAGALGLYAVAGDAEGLSRTPLEGLDPTRRLARIDFDGVPARALCAPGDAAPALSRALDHAGVSLSMEMVGVAERALETAVGYARVRTQFGRPIGSFQAVKHKCADVWIALEAARTAAFAALEAADAEDPALPELASMALARTSEACLRATAENVQVHGGIGFTWEHDAHLLLRRARASAVLLGDAAYHRERVARLRSDAGSAEVPTSTRSADAPADAAFRTEARAWLERVAKPRSGAGDWSTRVSAESDETEALDFERCRSWQRTLYDGGFAGITWPTRYGGRGGTPAQAMVFAEEERHFDVTSGFLAASLALVGPALLDFGSEAQRERYLRPLLRGDETWCQLFSEPDAGSDLANVGTRAERDGEGFVVNGQKLWTSSAQYCDFGILLARTDFDAPKHAGITFFVLDLRTPGVEVRPLRTSAGSTHFNEVFLTDVRVPAECVVGDVNGGWAVARSTLAHESVMIGTGSGRGGDAGSLLRLARQRGRFGDAAVRQRWARVHETERILDFMRERLRRAVLAGRAPDLDGSVLKVFRAELEVERNELALALQGPDAMLAGPDAPEQGFWQMAFLNAPLYTIGGGTLEVHRNGIGERVLGLPREPRVDREKSFRELRARGAPVRPVGR